MPKKFKVWGELRMMQQSNELTKRFAELLNFYDEHAKYGEKFLSVTGEVEFMEARLKGLAERWASARLSAARNDEQQDGDEPGCEVGIVQADGSPFIEDDEHRRMAMALKRLEVLDGEVQLAFDWLQKVDRDMRDGFMSVHNLVTTGEVPAECYMMLSEARLAYYDFELAFDYLRKAERLLLSIGLLTQ